MLGCGAAAKRTDIRSTSAGDANYLLLRRGIEAYSAGNYQSASAAFDSLLARVSPLDSQLAFIALYYGIRARVSAGSQSSADSIFELKAAAVAEGQHPELELALGRRPAPPEGIGPGETGP